MRRSILRVLRGERRWAMLRADCADALRLMPDRSVQCVVADPPYGIDFQSKFGKTRRFDRLANDKRPYIWWLGEAGRVLQPGGALVCFCVQQVQEDFRRAIELAGLRVRSQVIWDREWHGVGDTAAMFAPQHDVIWFATQGRGFAFRNRRPKSVLRFKRLAPGRLEHPTQKPVELLSHLIECTSDPEGLVLDPCAGSGSTGVAAVQLGRRFVGMELADEYTAVARRRLREARGNG